MIRYAITEGLLTGADLRTGSRHLHDAVHRWEAAGVTHVQLREKSLCAGELFELTRGLVEMLGAVGSGARLLVNTRTDVALAAGAHGVHLPAGAGRLLPREVRGVYAAAGASPSPVISISCHQVEEAAQAARQGADLILFGPVFEKVVHGTLQQPGSGLERLRQAADAAGGTPVLALGGVTAANTAQCLAAGAAGVAGIRLFGGAAHPEPVVSR